MENMNIDPELINKYLDGNLNEEENLLILSWINSSKENEQFLFQIKDLYDAGQWKKYFAQARTAEGWNELLQQIRNENTIERQSTDKLRFLLPLQRYAAVFLVGVLLTALAMYGLMGNKFQFADHTTLVSTGKGEKSQVTLPDGTKVWLNSASQIAYKTNFGSLNRDIELEGEAFFDVTKNPRLPFKVKADKFIVKALGTKFLVSAYPADDNLYAVLSEGSISFAKGEKSGELVLKPNQMVTYSKTYDGVSLSDVVPELYTSWRIGEVRFLNQTFEEVAKRLERQFNVKFVFVNQKVKQVIFTGTFYNYEKIDVILNVFQTNTHFKYEIRKDTIYIK
jgi:transmembrane sensor